MYLEQRAKLIGDWEALEDKYECRRPQVRGSMPSKDIGENLEPTGNFDSHSSTANKNP